VLSYTKMLGQLQDAGNTTTLAHYLDLLCAAGMVCGLQKYAFAVTLARRRWVPSSLYTFPLGLGSALSCALLRLEFADFDTIPRGVSHHVAQLSP